jgi:hypothetical protein
MTGQLAYKRASGNSASVSLSGERSAVEDVDAVRFFFSSGNIASGRIKMYGLK